VLLAASPSQAVAPASSAAVPAPQVLEAATAEGVAPAPAGVRRVLTPVLKDPALGKHRGAFVYDVQRRRTLLNTAGTFVPASTMKLLTTTAALATLGPDHRFSTKVVGTGSSIVLVGGGDPFLASRKPTGGIPPDPVPATLPDLATATVKALRAKGVRTVSLGYDASLFSGPAANRAWLPKYVSESIVSPTTALWADEGRKVPGMAARWPDPARAAANAFAVRLKAAGIKVSGTARPVRAEPGAPLVAQVRSPRLAAIAEHINLVSDNDGAEVLLRHVGITTHNGGSYAGGLTGLRSTLTGLGLDLNKARIQDGSGLSRTNGVPLQLLGSVLALAASDDHPELRAVITGLPVAGFTGSLSDRFSAAGSIAGSGYIRAKTGTLTSVHSLAGVVRDRTGTLLVFAVATDTAPPDKALAARTALDRVAGAIASCGCG
jgi:D-alanyl-D-alanine carboxypeptidase/D-alanyl-D-alanine-endopeptidase (penicillin-binding protein 4)